MLEVKNVYSSTGKTDPAVGISIENIAGDEKCGLYCARIGPFKRVGAHFHNDGAETYQIIEGSGKIYLGKPDKNNDLEWMPPVSLGKGDVFTVKPGEVHQLVNTGNEDLLVIFGCPASHLGEDRTIVKGIEG